MRLCNSFYHHPDATPYPNMLTHANQLVNKNGKGKLLRKYAIAPEIHPTKNPGYTINMLGASAVAANNALAPTVVTKLISSR